MSGSLGEVIKRMAVGANDANAPTSVLFGTVTSVNPLEIAVEQKMKLTKEFLVLTKNVKDYTVDVTVNWSTETKSLNANHSHTVTGDASVEVQNENIGLSHNHTVSGRKTITIHNGLKTNDNVILLQQQGANNYIVLDKF